MVQIPNKGSDTSHLLAKTISVTRSRTPCKPLIADIDPPVFYCSECGSFMLGMSDGAPSSHHGSGPTRVLVPPYTRIESIPSCCSKKMIKAKLQPLESLPEDISLEYEIVGGLDSNALKVSWRINRSNCMLEWVVLKTFTGIQIEYLDPGKKSPLVFGFAGDNAYAYCDKDPCIECNFSCKKGFTALACFKNFGLVRMAIDRRSAAKPT